MGEIDKYKYIVWVGATPDYYVEYEDALRAYNEWLDKLPSKKRIVLQSNDYFSHKEHVNCKQTLEEFQQDCKLNIDIAATMPTEKYNRFMIIGHKK
jgi:hypothetical protein